MAYVVRCWLIVVGCLIWGARCVCCVACFVVFSARCLQIMVWCLVCVVYCVLIVVRVILRVVCCLACCGRCGFVLFVGLRLLAFIGVRIV